MNIPKMAAGIETEYGIMILGADLPDPFVASQLLLGAYWQIGSSPVPCSSYYPSPTYAPSYDTATKQPSTEAENAPPASRSNTGDRKRHRRKEGEQSNQYPHRTFSTRGTDLMLTNGARYYIDHGHPEYSTPECLSPRLLVAADKAGERILAACQHWVNATNSLPPDRQLLVYKNNTDYKNNSYGCHENYLLSTELFNNLLYRKLHLIFRYLLPFFVTRIIFCGAGKVGAENHTDPAGFQLSQRADFFETLFGLQTTQQRPLFNTRDEPHADPARYRRLHVILGDANIAEFSTFLKVGTMQLILQMMEDGFIRTDLTLSNPLSAIQTVSRDLTFRQPLQMEDGRQMTAVEVQQVYLDLAQQYLEQKDGSDEQWEVWEEWQDALSMLPDQWANLRDSPGLGY